MANKKFKKKSQSKVLVNINVKLVVRKGGKDYFIKNSSNLQNSKNGEESREYITKNMANTSKNTQNEAFANKSVDSSNNERTKKQNFKTERINEQGFNYNQFRTFYAANPTYTNHIEKEVKSKSTQKAEVRDSPYFNDFTGKNSKRKNKGDLISKENINKN